MIFTADRAISIKGTSRLDTCPDHEGRPFSVKCKDFVLKYPVDFIFSLQSHLHQWRLTGLEVENTVKCQSGPCSSGRRKHLTIVPDITGPISSSVQHGLAGTLVVVVCSQSHYPPLTKLKLRRTKKRSISLKQNPLSFYFDFFHLDKACFEGRVSEFHRVYIPRCLCSTVSPCLCSTVTTFHGVYCPSCPCSTVSLSVRSSVSLVHCV